MNLRNQKVTSTSGGPVCSDNRLDLVHIDCNARRSNDCTVESEPLNCISVGKFNTCERTTHDHNSQQILTIKAGQDNPNKVVKIYDLPFASALNLSLISQQGVISPSAALFY